MSTAYFLRISLSRISLSLLYISASGVFGTIQIIESNSRFRTDDLKWNNLSKISSRPLQKDQLKGWHYFFSPKGLNEILIDCTVPERPPKGVNAFSRRCRSIVLIVANSIDFPGLWCRFSAYEKSRDTFCFSHWRLEGGSWPANRMLQCYKFASQLRAGLTDWRTEPGF